MSTLKVLREGRRNQGRFLTMAGEDILTMFTVIEGLIKSEISSVRDEINALNNYLNNASLPLTCSTGPVAATYASSELTVGCCTSTVTYANKESFADIVSERAKNVLRLRTAISSRSTQTFRHPDFETFDELKRPRQFTISFKYLVKRPGTLAFHFKNENKEGFGGIHPDFLF